MLHTRQRSEPQAQARGLSYRAIFPFGARAASRSANGSEHAVRIATGTLRAASRTTTGRERRAASPSVVTGRPPTVTDAHARSPAVVIRHVFVSEERRPLAGAFLTAQPPASRATTNWLRTRPGDRCLSLFSDFFNSPAVPHYSFVEMNASFTAAFRSSAPARRRREAKASQVRGFRLRRTIKT